MADKLFVYGTLHPGHAPAEIADVVQTMKPLGKGTIRGTRYELGEYPGVKISPKAVGRVEGEVFLLPSDLEALARLDEYEDFRPANPKQSLFRRRKATVTLKNGNSEVCWVYVYNRAIRQSRAAQPVAVSESAA